MVTFDQLMLPLLKALVNLMLPLLKALVNLRRAGSIDEIYEEVVELEKFDDNILAVLHNQKK